ERYGQEGPVAGGEGGIFGRRALVLDVPHRNRRAGLNRIGRGPARRRRPRLEEVVRELAAGRADDQLVVVEEAHNRGVAAEERRRLRDYLVQDRRRVELGSEQSAGACELLGERASAPLALVELAPFEGSAGRTRQVLCELQVVSAEATPPVEEHPCEPCAPAGWWQWHRQRGRAPRRW